jgi:aminopeptidase N
MQPANAEQPFSFDTSITELPKNIRPLAYRIELEPNLDQLGLANDKQDADFKGKVEVDVEVLRPADAIVLNAALDLTFQSIALDGVPLPLDSALRAEAKPDTVTIRLTRRLETGMHRLAIVYSGKVSRLPQGIYFSVYDKTAVSGKRWMLMTQFEPAEARRMFPGWDEPAFKATFALSAVLPREFRAVSNMPIVREEDQSGPGADGRGKKKVAFAPTPRMSTYLLVLVAAETGHLRQTMDGVDVGVIAPERRITHGRYALAETERLLRYYHDYFGTKYPLPKLDLIAIPNFVPTAMENWGGITYIDDSLLFDDKVSTQKTKEGVFETVGHEVAHQWFGNLVTMGWWEDLWLNEGFANWMQKKVSDELNRDAKNPSRDWKIRLRAHEEKEQVMDLDALGAAKPVQRKIAGAREADSAFDPVTYQKGSHVIHMIETTVGEETFRQGIRDYMNVHAYSSATTADLWAALKRAAGSKPTSESEAIEVAAIAAGFVAQPGIPLIDFKRRCSDGKEIITLTQEPLKFRRSAAKSDAPGPTPATWQVPVRVGRPGDKEPKLALVRSPQPQDKHVEVVFEGCDDSKPAKAAFGDVGYYRVKYDLEYLKLLGNAFWAFDSADRVNLLGDSWAMVEVGSDPGSFFDLIEHLREEPATLDSKTGYSDLPGASLALWTRVVATLQEIDDLERHKPGREAFRKYARGLLGIVFERLCWDPRPDEAVEAPAKLLLRALIIDTLGRFNDTKVIETAQEKFKSFNDDPESLNKELREAVATVVGYYARPNEFDQLHRLAESATDTETKLRYYYALAGAHDPGFIEKVRDIALTDDNLPSGRIVQLLARAASESDDPDRVWQLVFAKRSEILEKLAGAQKERLLPRVASASSAAFVAAKLKELRAEASEGEKYEIDKAVARIEFKAEFKERVLPQIDAWIGRRPRP